MATPTTQTTKTILITGATDGIGLATALRLAPRGHHLVLHGRDRAKLEATEETVRAVAGGGDLTTYVADLSRLADVERLAAALGRELTHLDVLLNNAGVLKTSQPRTPEGLDVRFVVNAISPYLLTRRLLPLLAASARVVNVSSAAQAPVEAAALTGRTSLVDGAAYAQSKLALTMWSRHLADELGGAGPAVIAVNPGSLLATKMVKQGFGIDGHDLAIGADILTRAALDDEFADSSGAYYDNDARRFAEPHPDALDPVKNRALVDRIEAIIAEHAG